MQNIVKRMGSNSSLLKQLCFDSFEKYQYLKNNNKNQWLSEGLRCLKFDTKFLK